MQPFILDLQLFIPVFKSALTCSHTLQGGHEGKTKNNRSFFSSFEKEWFRMQFRHRVKVRSLDYVLFPVP